MKTYAVQEILKTTEMAAYLSGKGIEPEARLGPRLLYKCPLHEEDTASFNIYPPSEKRPYDFFYCFGCKMCGNIITLKAKIENIGIGSVISSLSRNLSITADAEMDYLISEAKKIQSLSADYSPEGLSLLISRQIYNFLNSVNFEEPYFSMSEKVLALLDDAIDRMDMTCAKDIHEFLCEHLFDHVTAYTLRKEQETSEIAAIYAKIV